VEDVGPLCANGGIIDAVSSHEFGGMGTVDRSACVVVRQGLIKSMDGGLPLRGTVRIAIVAPAF